MAAVDVLPIAQPAARPDPAGAREPAPNDAGGSFANVLETEVDAADKTDGKADATGDKPADPALANAMAASAQPAPSPHTPTVNTAAAAIAAVLQAPEIQQTSGDKPAVETSGPTDAPASPNRSAGTAIPVPAISIGVPAESAAPKADTPAPQAALLAAAASASEAPTESVPTTAPAVAAAGSASPKAVKAQAAAEASERDSTEEAPKAETKTAVAPDAGPAAADAATGQPASAPAQSATPFSAVLAASVIAPPLAPKQAAPAITPDNAPGARRDAAAAAITPAVDPNAAAKPGAQPAASGATPTPAASGQTSAQAQPALAGADTTPDLKLDAPTPSPSASASFADALAAARGQSADAGKAQAASPHLQSAPAAAVQVYTRFVERFDGRAQRFEVRLDPAELGRVDVRIEVGADKKVQAVLAAHDSAALSDLMRGQRSLERALSDAGIDLADNGLRFELSQDAGRNLAGQQRGDGWSNDEAARAWRGFSTVDVAVDASAADAAAATRSYSRRSSRLDLVA